MRIGALCIVVVCVVAVYKVAVCIIAVCIVAGFDVAVCIMAVCLVSVCCSHSV